MIDATPPTDKFEFHNAHLWPLPGGKWQLARYPYAILHQLNEKAPARAMDSCGIEIRFTTPAPECRLTLSCENQDGELYIYRGAFLIRTQTLKKGVPTVVELLPPEAMEEATDEALAVGGFSKNLYRLLLGRGCFIFHHYESFGYALRPPGPDEGPAIKWLAYGSSITHSNPLGYPYHAARLLHWNVYGKGLSASCHIDQAAVDYLAAYAAQKRMDVITAELGVNMRNRYGVDEFTRRASYFIRTVRQANPCTPLVLITAFTNSGHHPRDTSVQRFANQRAYDASLRRLHQEAQDPYLHLIEGTELLPDFSLLKADVLHPSPTGEALMGYLLADRLRSLLKQNRHAMPPETFSPSAASAEPRS